MERHMSDLASDIISALQNAARAGASAASTAGRDLSGDIENFVVPQLREIGIHVAETLEKQQQGIFSTDMTQTELASQCTAVRELIETVATLAVEEVEKIYNAIVGALSSAVNTAIGITLLPV
jgi:hypothetical protein